jgi:hypothetical protein
MVVNFRARGISRGARKLARTPTLIIYIKKKIWIMLIDVDIYIYHGSYVVIKVLCRLLINF